MGGCNGAIGKTAIVTAILVSFGALAACNRQPISLKGAVVRQDPDPTRQQPIADVEISASDGSAAGTGKSDSSGHFDLRLRAGIKRGTPVTLSFRHADYEPLDMKQTLDSKIYVARMAPISTDVHADNKRATVPISSVIIKYSMKTATDVNIGSALKTFQIANTGNVPCNNQEPCSPDGKWKAAVGSTSLDAGEGNEFRNARLSCVAGPCPFTKIQSDAFSRGGRIISAYALNWSDTTTFLLEAEVYHPMASEITRESHPVIFGQALNFTLPAAAEGPSIAADINGEPIVFPLGPNLCLSWATCSVRGESEQTKIYRCELKSGYQFR